MGSIKVNTINLARLAYENPTKQEYLNALKGKVELCLKTLDVIRHIIRRNAEKGLLPNFNLNVIEFASCYNTIGIIGIYEALQKFGMIETKPMQYTRYTPEGLAFAKQILKTIHIVKDNFAIDKDYKINIEQIPKHHWGVAA